MKDSFVLGASCWVTYNFYKIFVSKDKILINILFLILIFSILINIKSYVAISLLPWFLFLLYINYLKDIKSQIIKIAIAPELIIIFGVITISFINNLEIIGLEQYKNMDKTIEQAQVIQQDLLR